MAGFRIRDEMNGIEEAPGKTWFWELESAVIDADRCIQCGTCVAACPSDSIGVGPDDLPRLVKMCTGCSLCWDFCPRGGLRYEATWPDEARLPVTTFHAATGMPQAPATRTAAVREDYTARVRGSLPGAQDGGVVTAVLAALLEAGEIDGALVARPSPTETWKGIPFLARTRDELLECAGSFYNQTMALGHLDMKGYDLPPDPRVAVVGTPCEVQGIRAMQARPWGGGWGRTKLDAVVLTVALLCTKSFNYKKLMVQDLQERRGIDLADVGKVDVLHGKMIVEDRAGQRIVEESVRNFHGAALKGCDECADFLGHGADISVGSVGSADGWSSVLLRTEAGQKAFALARPGLETRALDKPEALDKLDALDKKVALAALQRPFAPEAPLFIDHADHLRDYEGTDRAPVVRDR
jgi:coenzyme F420 hydrogenase subunit beta